MINKIFIALGVGIIVALIIVILLSIIMFIGEEIKHEKINNELYRKQLAKKSKTIYASGRTAIQAKILGCKVLPHETNFPDSRFWKVIDNKDAAKMLQKMLDEIDNVL